MSNREYILTVHWKQFGPRKHTFYNFSNAIEAIKILDNSPSVSYVTLKSQPRKIPTLQEAYAAWYELHSEEC